MFMIGEAIVDERLADERFACDVAKCKGACCTLPGGGGAPLQDEEVAELERAYPAAKKYLSERNLQVVERLGSYEGERGNFATVCVDHRDCVFVHYEGGIARCSLEKAFLKGETTWRKPLSCHLFPIRISSESVTRLRYEKLPECSDAVKRGLKEDIPLYEFLKPALIRRFGEAWYDEFRAECERRNMMRSKEFAF